LEILSVLKGNRGGFRGNDKQPDSGHGESSNGSQHQRGSCHVGGRGQFRGSSRAHRGFVNLQIKKEECSTTKVISLNGRNVISVNNLYTFLVTAATTRCPHEHESDCSGFLFSTRTASSAKANQQQVPSQTVTYSLRCISV